jgi:hypothetical protein
MKLICSDNLKLSNLKIKQSKLIINVMYILN